MFVLIDQGKKSIKNQEDNIYAITLKCENQDSTACKKYGADQLVDKNGYQPEEKDDGTRATEGKQQKRDRIIKTEYDNRDVKSNKQQKKSHTSDMEDKKAGTRDIKSNKGKTDYLFDTEEDRGRIIKSKDTDMKGHGVGADSDEQNAFNNAKLKKGIKKSHERGNDEDEKAADSDMKWREGKKNRYRSIINKIEGSGGIKMKSKKDKEKNQIEEVGRNNIKLKSEKEKAREDDNNRKFKCKDHRWRGEKGEERSNGVDKNKEDNIKDDVKRKCKARRNKQNWKNEINKKAREGDSNAPNDKYKNKRHHVKSNVPEKYLERLLKVSKSTEKHLDIDMLLLPYVVFAQGDTYFRILPANQYPKFAGNYSLV